MARYGLSREERLREPAPWGLDGALLQPWKTVTDPVHKDVYLTKLEVLVLDSPPVQRLRRIRQLATTHLVYPGASHTRFAHALGTLRAAQNLLDAVRANHSGPHPARGLLDEWGSPGRPHDEFASRWAEATVLARLGALLHDLCHIPMGHTIEDDLGVLLPHDANWPRFSKLWAGIDEQARGAIEAARSIHSGPDGSRNPSLWQEVLPMILPRLAQAYRDQDTRLLNQYKRRNDEGKMPPSFKPGSYAFVEDIVGNTICADLLDYIRRDHLNTGLPIAVGTRFAADFYVRGSTARHWPGRMVIRIQRDGRRRTDVVSELMKLLRYRYELNERALGHHAKLAADAMLDKMLHVWTLILTHENLAADESARVRQLLADTSQMHGEAGVALDGRIAELRGTDALKERVTRADDAVRRYLEEVFTTHGDDGLLEHLAHLAARQDSIEDARSEVRSLAQALLTRRLFKELGGTTPAALVAAEETYKHFGQNAVRRRELERKAAATAGVSPTEVSLWVPHPSMRLKVAYVLVDTSTQPVAPLHRIDDDARYLTDRHRELWRVGVYASRAVRQAPRRARLLLSFIADEMDVPMTNRAGEQVASLADTLTSLVVESTGLDTRRTEIRQQVVTLTASSGKTSRNVITEPLDVLEVLNQVRRKGARAHDQLEQSWLDEPAPPVASGR